MKLFAPVPRRIIDISRIMEEVTKELLGEVLGEVTNEPCLTWSSITFGPKELKLQQICRNQLFKYDYSKKKKYFSCNEVEVWVV